jgi:hypothetical protein
MRATDRMDAPGDSVIWGRLGTVLRGLVEKSSNFRTQMEAFCAKLNGEYF